jgi:hypothetical protein
MLPRRARLCGRPLDDKLISYGQKRQTDRIRLSKIMMARPEEMGRTRTSRKLLRNSLSSIEMLCIRISFLENLTKR